MKFLEENYDIWTIINTVKVHKGHLNNTHIITTTKWKFVYQEICEDNPEWRVELYVRIKHYLKRQWKWNLISDLILTNSGSPLLQVNWSYHRLYKYVENDDIHFLNSKQAYSAGKLLGSLHSALRWFSDEYTQSSHHDIPLRLNEMKDCEDLIKTSHHKEIFDKILHWIWSIEVDMMRDITTIHGDTKIYNFLFKWDEALCMVDVDWFLNRSILWDIGDWIRTIAKKETIDGSYDLNFDLIESFLNWYNQYSYWSVHFEEGIKAYIITLYILASRYFVKMLHNDASFTTWKSDNVTVEEYYLKKIYNYLAIIERIKNNI